MECSCGVVLANIPWWTDRAIAVAAFIIALGIAFICYLMEEGRRHKNFYGKEDKISNRETREPISAAERQRENEMEAAAMGAYAGDVIVTRTTPFDPTEEPGKFKVMVTQRKKTTTPLPGGADQSPKKTAVIPSPDSPYKIVLQLELDKTGRFDEFLTEFKKEQILPGEASKVLENTMESILDIIEKMTGKSFLVMGVTQDGDQKTTMGKDLLEGNDYEASLQMKLQLLQPFKATIMAYQYEVARPKLDIPVQTGNVAPKTDTEHIQTDVTPQTPMKSSQPQASNQQSAPVARGQTPTTQAVVAPPPASSPPKDIGSSQAVVESNKNEMKLSALRKALKSNQSKTKTPRTTVNKSAKKVKESLKARMAPAQPQSGGSGVKRVSQTKMAPKADSKYESKEKSKEKTGTFTPSVIRKKINSNETEVVTNEAKNAANENSTADRITNFHQL